MAFYNKIGLLVLNNTCTKFLVCEKDPEDMTGKYIMPGGKFEEENDLECLKSEINEELNCDLEMDSLEVIGEYTDIAAGRPDREVSIKLYRGNLIGQPKPSSEIKFIHWIGKEGMDDIKVSAIIRRKIIPDLLERGILV